ncbi:MAG: guanine deaminase [Cohaesibacter sp.]|jgi:guanine deaminase|nr:guanine deaminase [Cohaesibacter sp.]
MTQTMLRGRILTFRTEPSGPGDESAYFYEEDGAIIMEEGRILACGAYPDLAPLYANASIIDHRPHLLMPGFVDAHLHFPQVQVIASWGAQLLDWLHDYTFPQEALYASKDHAQAMAKAFFDELINHGTTTAAAYCSVHKESADAFFAEASRRNMRMIGGKVMMDRNAIEDVHDTPLSSYEDSKALIKAWHGKGRNLYAITPRFAITSSPEQLGMAQSLVREHPDCFVQTHLSENKDEIALTKQLYPKSKDYLGVYEDYGLLGPKMLLGHCIHLEPREIEVLAETGSKPVFCPTSNLFLGSGLFDDAGLRARGITNLIATDIGGGTSYSMLQTLNEGYKILQLQGQKLDPLRAFYWITHGNAKALGLESMIGTLEAGTEADIVVLDSRATSAMALRMERAENLAHELFILQIMGDDRAVNQTYAAGVAQKH